MLYGWGGKGEVGSLEEGGGAEGDKETKREITEGGGLISNE